MATLLKPYVCSRTETSVKNSVEMVTLLDTIRLSSEERLISLDVVSLYTKIPLKPTIDLLAALFPTEIFKFILFSTYFVYDGIFCKQTEGVPMGSPLFPIITQSHLKNKLRTLSPCDQEYVIGM